VSTTFRAATQQLFVDLDRNKAEVLGVPVQEAFQTMQSFFGSSVAGQFSQFSRIWWVVLQADPAYRAAPADFSKVYVRSHSGKMVPLSALITVRYVAAPKLLERFNGFPAVKVTGNPAEGYSSGQAIAAMEEVARETLSADFSFSWAGQALQEKASGSTSAIAFVAGLIVVFLLLAAQFEKWTLPLAVVLTVPIARRLLAPGPEAIASGTQPRPKASEVMTMARIRARAASSAASSTDIPARTCSIATSQIRMAFFADSPTSVTRPTWKYTSFSSPRTQVSSIAPSTAIGTGVIGGILASTFVAVFFAPLFFWMLESVSRKVGGRKAAGAANVADAPDAAPNARQEGG
jgi:multidrug efflux pump